MDSKIRTDKLLDDYIKVVKESPLDKIEYVAKSPEIVNSELDKLFHEIDILYRIDLNLFEIFYYSSLLHSVFVKIQSFQNGNGRTAPLIQKWFLVHKFEKKSTSGQLEKNYYRSLKHYYYNSRKIVSEYGELDYSKCFDFLLLTVKGIDDQE
jgi:hypothetical protein